MNHVIVTQINGLTKKYENALANFTSKDDDFAVFNFDYKNYYKPFSLYIIPELRQHLKKNPQENFKMYEHLIHPKYSQALFEEMTEEKKVNSDFLKKLSEDMVKDFNKLIIAYRKMAPNLKDKFIEHFIKNKKDAFLMIAENNPELAIKTIASLCSPRLQFFLLNKLEQKMTQQLGHFIEIYCWERVMKVLTEYCYYPPDIDPKEYFNQWEGKPYLHIKFCRAIMGSKYEEAKKFLKAKSKYQALVEQY